MNNQQKRRLSTAEHIGKELAEQHEKAQKVVFTNWINFHLAPHGVIVDDIYEELRDGVILYKLLGILTQKKLPSLRHANIMSKRLDNLNICLRLLESQKVHIFNVDARDIEQGHYKIILALIYAMWVHFEVKVINSSEIFKPSKTDQPNDQSIENEPKEDDDTNKIKACSAFSQQKSVSSDLNVVQKRLDIFETKTVKPNFQTRKKMNDPSIKTQILDACNVILHKYGLVVKDIINSCKDGRVFLGLIHCYDPSLVNFDSITSEKGQDNIKKAIQIAKEKLRIVASFEPEEFLNDTSINETGPIAFISSLLLAINSEHTRLSTVKRSSVQAIEPLTDNDNDKKLSNEVESPIRNNDHKKDSPAYTKSVTISEPVSNFQKVFEVFSSIPNTYNIELKLFNEPIHKKRPMPKICALANKSKYRLNMQEINQETYFRIWSLNNNLTEEHGVNNNSVRLSITGTPHSQTQIFYENSIKRQTSITKSNDSSDGHVESTKVTIEGYEKNLDRTKWEENSLLSENTAIQKNEDRISKNEEYFAHEIIEGTTKELIPSIAESTIYQKSIHDDTISDQNIPIQLVKSPILVENQDQPKESIVDKSIITTIISSSSFSGKVDNQFNIPESVELKSEENDNKNLIYIVNALYENDKLLQEYQKWLKEKINSVIKLKNSVTELNTQKETYSPEKELTLLSESMIELVKRRKDDYCGVEYYEQNIFIRFEHLGQKIKFKITKNDLFKEWIELFELLKKQQTIASTQVEQKFKAEQVEQSILYKIDIWETIINQFNDFFETNVDLTALRSLSEKYTEFVSKCNAQLENDLIVISGNRDIKIRLKKLNILFDQISTKYKSMKSDFFLDISDSVKYDNRSKLLLRKGCQIYDSIQSLIRQKSSPTIQGNEFLLALIKEEYEDYQNKVAKYKYYLAPDVIELCKQLSVAFKTVNDETIYSNKFLQWKNEAKQICLKVKRIEKIFNMEKTDAFEFFYNISSKIKLFELEKLAKKFDKIKLKAKQIKESISEIIKSENIDSDYLLKKESKFDNEMIKLNTLSEFINRSYESFYAFERICLDYSELMISMSNYILGSYERSVKMVNYLPEDYNLAITSSKETGGKFQASYELLETNIKLFSSNFKSFCDDYKIEKTELDVKLMEMESNLGEKYLQFNRKFTHEDQKLAVDAKLYNFNQKVNQLALKMNEDNVMLTSVGKLISSDSANILKAESIEPISAKISNIKMKITLEYTPELATINRLLVMEDRSFNTLQEFTISKITNLTQMISSTKISLDETVKLLNQFILFIDIIASCENMKQATKIFYQRYWSSSYFYRNVLRTKLISDIQDVIKKWKNIPDSEYYTRDSISENCKRAINDLNDELKQIINLKCFRKLNTSSDFKLLFKKSFLWWNILLFKTKLFFDFDLTMHDADYKFDFFTELNDELVNHGDMCQYFSAIRKTNDISFDNKEDKELLENIVLSEKLDKSIQNKINKCAIYLKKASDIKKLNLTNKNIKILSYFTTNAIKYINSEISKSNNQISEDSLLQIYDVESLLQTHNTAYNESLKALKNPKKADNSITAVTLKNVDILINRLNEATQRAKQKIALESLLRQITQTDAYVKNRIVSCSYENFYCIYLKKCLAHSITATQMKRKGNSIVGLLNDIKAYIERKDMGFETVSTRYSQLCLSLNDIKKIIEEENKCVSFNYVKSDIPLYISLQKYEITYAEMFVKAFLKKSSESQSNYLPTEDDSKSMAFIKHSKKILDNITKLENSTEMIELQEQMNKTIRLYEDRELYSRVNDQFNNTKGIIDYIEKWLTDHLTEIKTLLSLEINSTNISQTNQKIKILMEIFDVKNSKLVIDTLSNCKKQNGDFLKDLNSDKLKIVTDEVEKIDTITSEIRNCCTEVEKKMKFETNKYLIESELEMWEVTLSTLYNSHCTKISEDNLADIIKRIGKYNYTINFTEFFLNSTSKALNEKCNDFADNDKKNLSLLKDHIQDIGKNCSDIQFSLSKGKEKLNERGNLVQIQKETQSIISSTDTSYLNVLRIEEYMYMLNYYINENNSYKEDYVTLKESFELQNAIPVSFCKQSKNTSQNLHNEWIFSTNILIKHINEVIDDLNRLSKISNQPFSVIQKVKYDFVLMNFLHLNSWIRASRSKYNEISKGLYLLENSSRNGTANILKVTNDLLKKKLDELNTRTISVAAVFNSQMKSCSLLSRANKINCHAAYLCQNIRRKIPPENISECIMDLSTRDYRLSTIRHLNWALSKLNVENQKKDMQKSSNTKQVKSILSTCESLIENAYSDFNFLFETLLIEFNAFVVAHDISKLSNDISEIIKIGKTLMTKTTKIETIPSTNIVYQYIIEFLNNQCITQKTALIEDEKAVNYLVIEKMDPVKRKIDLESDETKEKIIRDKFSFIVPQKYSSVKKDTNKEYPLILSGYFLMKKIDPTKNENVENSDWQLYVFGMYKKAICYFSPTNATLITSKNSGIFKSLINSIKLDSSPNHEIFLNIQFKDDGDYMLWFNNTNELKNFNNSLDTTKLRTHK